jgi:hypothetical protein
MPTIDDILSALNRYGLKKVLSVGFGIFGLFALNYFHSTPTIDLIGNIVFGGLTVAALLIPNKE